MVPIRTKGFNWIASLLWYSLTEIIHNIEANKTNKSFRINNETIPLVLIGTYGIVLFYLGLISCRISTNIVLIATQNKTIQMVLIRTFWIVLFSSLWIRNDRLLRSFASLFVRFGNRNSSAALGLLCKIGFDSIHVDWVFVIKRTDYTTHSNGHFDPSGAPDAPDTNYSHAPVYTDNWINSLLTCPI